MTEMIILLLGLACGILLTLIITVMGVIYGRR